MFHPGYWAAALMNSLEKSGGEIEEGVEILKALAWWVKNLPVEVFGNSPAEKAEMLVREVMTKAGVISPAGETAIRLFVLMVKKNKIRHLDLVIEEAKKLLDNKRGVIPVSIEYAFPVDEDVESRIKETIKKRTGAVRVDITGRIIPELIGGYRLRIGDEVIDASIRSQLRKLETCLATADGGN